MYLVVELQTNDGTMAYIATVCNTRAEAERKFHTVLAAAAVSELDCHSCAILDQAGTVVKRDGYWKPESDGGDES